MSEGCTHNCETCSQNCGERNSPRNMVEKPNPGSRVNKVIGVVSGKGGVGKSLVTSLLAVSMQRKGYKAAVLDADITADDANDFVDTAARIGFFHHIPGRIAFPAVLAASFAVVCEMCIRDSGYPGRSSV